MSTRKKTISPADLLAPEDYAARRTALRRALVAAKKNRRMEVGPVATFYFESYETMLQQVQEMLHIEKGGAAQIEDELAAYNPLIPQGSELVATVMFEIDDPARRARFLARLGGVERTAFLKIGEESIRGIPEADQERTNAAGKASSVHFMRFPLTRAAIAAFKQGGAPIVLGFDHPEYSHMAVMPEQARAALAADLD